MRQTRKHLRSLADEQGFLYRRGLVNPTVKIYEDGSLIRADVDLTIARNMTVAEAYKALGLNYLQGV